MLDAKKLRPESTANCVQVHIDAADNENTHEVQCQPYQLRASRECAKWHCVVAIVAVRYYVRVNLPGNWLP